MIFLFVGSSALTEASFPRNLAIPQLLRSNVLAIVPLGMSGPTIAFTHRGLSPHQFTPMSGAHKTVQAKVTAPVSNSGVRSHNTVVAVVSTAASGGT